jgi:alkylation response protein AidB-like acyl-CoA dehydrogenase
LSPSSKRIAQLLAGTDAPEADWRRAFRLAFAQLRGEVDLHPVAATPAATFEAAACSARAVAAECLPLGIGLLMHFYPLCALRCVPLPWWSPANYRRQRLLRAIDRHSWILANAGSERAAGAHVPVTLTRGGDDLRAHGTYDYVSLANVADLVLFQAPLSRGDGNVFCIADLRADTVRIGAARFSGSMKLSDTCSVSFENHLLPADRVVAIPDGNALGCMAQYQRSWFQLLACEAHLARIEHLRERWNLPLNHEDIASHNELALMREYALGLLNAAASTGAIDSLSRVTAAMKLRVSWRCLAVAAAVEKHDAIAAGELRFLKRQPTSDERILAGIGVPAAARPLDVSIGPRAMADTSPPGHIRRGEYSLQT